MTSRRAALLALFFASGFTGLVYEVLWLRALALVFGNTAYATAATLAVFFLGLAAGQAVYGHRAHRLANPISTYAFLELAVAVTAATYFILVPLYRSWYPGLFAALGERPLELAAAKVALSSLVLFPPAFCMGATLPVVGQILVRRARALGETFGLLYGANTLGGAAGALVASFYLPSLLGYERTYTLAIACSLAIAALAYRLGRDAAPLAPDVPPGAAPRRAPLLALACVSGAATLGLEVLWTRMFAQVLHNSVYSFATILVTFLAALALGSFLAQRLSRGARRPLRVLFFLLLASGVAVGATPWVFDSWTGGLAYLGRGQGWGAYVAGIFGTAAVALLVPGVLIGSVFPYLVGLQAAHRGAGAAIGALASANTVGSVVGSLAAGFVLLPALGLWRSIHAAAIVYLLLALAVAHAGERLAVFWRAAPILAGVLILAAFDPGRPAGESGRGDVVARLESAFGTVSVVERGTLRSMLLDGHYSVGANGAIPNDWRQADLPLFLHPRPRSVFFLGMGTGITAGAALLHPVEHVTTAELVPDIVTAAREYFAPFTGGLFTDPRSRVVVADGRAHLAATAERFDVIIADLFVPWHAGTGNLYTVESFASVRDHLTERGLFAQWLPLYQLSAGEVAVIVRTMLEIFPQVTLWRGDFSPDAPIVALIGHVAPLPIDLDAVVTNVRQRLDRAEFPSEQAKALVLLFYAGNPGQAHELFDPQPLNTDDRPVIELTAPVTQRRVEAGTARWLTSNALLSFYDELTAAVPVSEDTFLLGADERTRDYARAGLDLYRARVLAAIGKNDEVSVALGEFAARVPPEVARMFGANEARGVRDEERE